MCGDSALLAVECVKLFHNLIIICLNSLETLVLLSMSMEALHVPLHLDPSLLYIDKAKPLKLLGSVLSKVWWVREAVCGEEAQ